MDTLQIHHLPRPSAEARFLRRDVPYRKLEHEDVIGSMLYERTALSKKPDKLIKQELAALRSEDKLTPDLVFRDPCILDFLGLKDTSAEKVVEAAILREVERFILELGVGFAFL